MNVRANSLHIVLAEGVRDGVTADVNRLLSQQDANIRVVAVEYNYQAPEYFEGQPVAQGQHGILLVLTTEENWGPPWISA